MQSSSYYHILLKVGIKYFDQSITNIRTSINILSDLKLRIIKFIFILLKKYINIYNELNSQLNQLLFDEPKLRNELDEICFDVENSKHNRSNSTQFLSSRRSQVWASIEILISKRNKINQNITDIILKGRILWSLSSFYKNMEIFTANSIEESLEIPIDIEQLVSLNELPSKSADLFIHFCKVTWEIGTSLSRELDIYQKQIMDALEAREESIQLISAGDILMLDNPLIRKFIEEEFVFFRI